MSDKRKRHAPVLRGAVYACAVIAVALYGVMWLTNSSRAGAAAIAPPVQLVRLNVSAEGGLVRIEIIADGLLGEVTTETRGRETILRVNGARSLLHPNYPINDSLASGVRTTTGERDGQPFVEIAVNMAEGASIAQRKSFNRLLIGIAADFARLRRPSNATTARLEQARNDAKAVHPKETAASFHSSSRTVVAKADAAANGSAETNSRAYAVLIVVGGILTTDNFARAPKQPRAASVVAKETSPVVFHGHAIWSAWPDVPPVRLARSDMARVPLMFLQTPQLAVAQASSGLTQATSFLPMTLDAPGATPGYWIPGTTTAVSDQVGGRVLGAGFLRPSFLFGAEYNDNFFYRSTAGRNLGLFTFAPRLEYEIPGEARALRVAYEARLRRLTNGHWANGQTLDFDSRFDVSRMVRLALRNHLVRSALDAREYDPAGETYIEGDTFTRNDSAVRSEFTLNDRNRLALDLGYNFVRWRDQSIAAAPLFINYAELRPAFSIEHDVSERTTALAEVSFTNTNASVPLRPQFDGLNDRRQFDVLIGARTQMSETSGLAFRAGFERSTSRNAPSVNDFSGFVFDALYRRDLSKKTNFQLSGLRKTQVSSFNPEGGNARLISTGFAARLERNQTEALKLGFAVNYQRLGFPVAVVADSTASGGLFVGNFAGLQRRDHLYGFGLDAGYRFSDLLRARLAYSFARRDSNVSLLTFNRNLLSLVLELGRRNDVRGRSF